MSNHNTVSFQNEGLIDLRAVKTFGVSVKDRENPIGFFGTGLKYAVAILLRTGHEVAVWRGMDEHRFGISNVEVRGQKFNIVTLDGDELGMTTDVGKTWQMWMALRELYCNTSDEGGESKEGIVEPKEGHTTFHVTGQMFRKEFAARDRIFLTSEPFVKCGSLDIHLGSNSAIFYRGVRVYDLSKPSRYTYNITCPIDLTEDRTVKYWFEAHNSIASGLLKCERKDILRDVLTSRDFESSVSFANMSETPGDAFMDVVGTLRQELHRDLNPSAKQLHASVTGNDDRFTEVILLDAEQAQVNDAVTFLHSIGIPVSEFPIKFAESLGAGVLGLANMPKREIWISRRCLMQGGRMLIGTILEEYLHLSHGVEDESREMQNLLLDMAVTFAERWSHSQQNLAAAAE